MPARIKGKKEKDQDGPTPIFLDDQTPPGPSAPVLRKRKVVKYEVSDDETNPIISDAALVPATHSPAPVTPARSSPAASPKKRKRRCTNETNTPSKAALKKAKAAEKRKNEDVWLTWCREHKWDKGVSYKHQVWTTTRHKGDAKGFYGLKDNELETIPCETFRNKNCPKRPGRSYNDEDLITLVYRKHAVLAGVDQTDSNLLLNKGKELFSAFQVSREAKSPNIKALMNKTGQVRPRHSFDYYLDWNEDPHYPLSPQGGPDSDDDTSYDSD